MVYYVETNLIAILVAAVLLFVGRGSSNKLETSQIIMDRMLFLLIIASMSDIAACYFRGESYLGSQLANVAYLEAFALGAFAWFLFIIVELGYSKNVRKIVATAGIPVALLCVAIAFNPLTGFFFTVDDQLLYHRGPGVIVSWIVEWGYMLVALSLNVRSVLKETRSYRRQEYCGYLVFSLPIAIAAISQMLVYGITSTQIGFMLALLLVYLNKQHYQVHRDALTGLNNKNAFLSFLDAETARQAGHTFTLFVIDMDNFKQINDIHGHVIGDHALSDAADVLKSASNEIENRRLLLYRYGGDEFVVIGRDMTEGEVSRFGEAIDKLIALKNDKNHADGQQYHLAMSVGHAVGKCHEIADFDKLIKQADTAMYAAKQSKKAARGQA